MKKIVFFALLTLSAYLISCGGDSATSTEQSSKDSKTTTSEGYKPTIQTSLGIVIDQASGKSGEEVCVGVSVKDFNKIVSMQHSVNWDPNVLIFNRLQNFNLKGLSDGSFGLTKTTEGNFGVSWYDPSVRGISLADQTKIYEICFELSGAKGSSSTIRISDKPVSVEVSNADERILGIPTGNGKIIVE